MASPTPLTPEQKKEAKVSPNPDPGPDPDPDPNADPDPSPTPTQVLVNRVPGNFHISLYLTYISIYLP